MQGRALVLAALAFGLTLAAPDSFAQAGDNPGEAQPDVPEEWLDFESPVLSPKEALKSIVVKPGFRVELVASEPLIEDPVAMAFDGSGRMWVVEMRGFMPDAEGENEHAPVGRIVILDDEDGDGRMDTSTVFADRLVLPRAIGLAYGGAIVIEPPDLLFMRDENGDDRADLVLHLASGFAGLQNPEHAGNGLMHGIDNWIHLSQHPERFRFDGENIQSQPTPGHGQWGITKDDVGRIFYTTNSDPLRADLVPLHYASRNPDLGRLIGVNERMVHDFSVHPIHLTPGINRGYQEHMLDEGRLTRFTAACGPVIYRGDLFPEAFHGDAFVCEPAGNLVSRFTLVERDDGTLVGERAYESSEFLASTDERFRPVNAYNGPDGGLYIVDMYRGVLQHRIYMTSFLRAQVEERGLETPLGLGRIYRIVPDDASVGGTRDLSNARNEELAALLESPNGWRRDTAQRLLVERRASDVAPQLRALATESADVVPRLHALWTLEGVGALTIDDAIRACASREALLRIHGLRLLERWIDDPRAVDVVASMIDDAAPDVRVQAALSLGDAAPETSLDLLERIVSLHADHRPTRSAVLSSLNDREIELLARLLLRDDWASPEAGRRTMVEVLLGCITRSGRPAEFRRLCELAVDREAVNEWQSSAILASLASAQRLTTERPRFLMLDREPSGWREHVERASPGSSTSGSDGRAAKIDRFLFWPGREDVDRTAGARPLTTAERARFERGRRLYLSVCRSCHQADGRGQPGTAPTLVGSEWVLGPEERLARILLHGMTGPIEVDGVEFDADMPRSPLAEDEQIAAILTYVRRAWGNDADPVDAAAVARVRRDTAGRREPWTVEELRRQKDGG